MQNNPLINANMSDAEKNTAIESYYKNLIEEVRKEIPMSDMVTRVSLSPCGKHVLLGLFRQGLEPKEGEDIWKVKPRTADDSFITIVCNSDIFIKKPNVHSLWSKFTARKDASALTNILFVEHESRWNITKHNLKQ